ncbi:hypothetical protein [Hyphomonas pacifica]|uniref:Uncharacterized protein n=1 Tax=Hyphomonas pacifica TaxID=1280941 RepID=A0A062TXS3_9PROT|nr:hypothetical protein [Hyphomonas pacifica]KCZ50293.1 hypothetical protein HY2_14545 [Hyphomonas pacifica]RAN32788.1 hypothetical protein HY3_14160 [Hyphomonas pacifica]RAN34167.1 hypothetical protein HY11_15650 [Hyphomonas pacifica]
MLRPPLFHPTALSAALLGLVTACGDNTGPARTPTYAPQETGTRQDATDIGSGDTIRVLSADKRLAFAAAQFAAGKTLYQAGEAENAAWHFYRIGAEIPDAERAALQVIGFDANRFDNIALAIEAGAPPKDIDARLAAADAHLADMFALTENEPAALVGFLMDNCVTEYEAGVVDSAITEPHRYELAYGLAAEARNLAYQLEEARDLQMETELLARMWPSDGPVMSGATAPVPLLATQASRVKLQASILD